MKQQHYVTLIMLYSLIYLNNPNLADDLCDNSHDASIIALYKANSPTGEVICHVPQTSSHFDSYERSIRVCLNDHITPLNELKINENECDNWKIVSLKDCLELPNSRFHAQDNFKIMSCRQRKQDEQRERIESAKNFLGGNWGTGVAHLHYTNHNYDIDPSKISIERRIRGENVIMFEIHHYLSKTSNHGTGSNVLGYGPFVALGAKIGDSDGLGISITTLGAGIMIGIKGYDKTTSHGLNFGIGVFRSYENVNVQVDRSDNEGNETQTIKRESRGTFIIISTKW